MNRSRAYIDLDENAIVMEVSRDANTSEVHSLILDAVGKYVHRLKELERLSEKMGKTVDGEFEKQLKKLEKDKKKFANSASYVDHQHHLGDYERMRKDLETQKGTELENAKERKKPRVIVNGVYDKPTRESFDSVLANVKDKIGEKRYKREHWGSWAKYWRDKGHYWDENFERHGVFATLGVGLAVSKMRKKGYEHTDDYYKAFGKFSRKLKYAPLGLENGRKG